MALDLLSRIILKYGMLINDLIERFPLTVASHAVPLTDISCCSTTLLHILHNNKTPLDKHSATLHHLLLHAIDPLHICYLTYANSAYKANQSQNSPAILRTLLTVSFLLAPSWIWRTIPHPPVLSYDRVPSLLIEFEICYAATDTLLCRQTTHFQQF